MPHHLKEKEAESGTTLDRPARAKARTSSKAAQGFFSCFSRSARWALDSFFLTTSVICPFFSRYTKPAAAWLLRGHLETLDFDQQYRPRSPVRAEQRTAATTG